MSLCYPELATTLNGNDCIIAMRSNCQLRHETGDWDIDAEIRNSSSFLSSRESDFDAICRKMEKLRWKFLDFFANIWSAILFRNL